MFREMRRKDKFKTPQETVQILESCTNGILSVTGDGGYPYGVPVSYVYIDGKIYFHCAPEGHKMDAIKADPKVSFCVVGADNVSPEKFTTKYKSVICFGKASVVENEADKQAALELIIGKYSADFIAGGLEHIRKMWDKTAVVQIDIQHMTGKGLEK